MAIEHSENRQQQDERLRRERSEADATLARLKADYANSPEQRLRANREELARLQSDPFLADRRRGDITRLERQVMIGERNLEAAAGRMSQYEKLDLALGGATDPEASVRIGADLSVDDMRIQIEHDRNNGLSDHVRRPLPYSRFD